MTENSGERNMTDLNNKNAAVEPDKTASPTQGAADAFREGWFEIKTQAEIPVISKTARIVEEVVISRLMTQHTETVRDSVKRTSVKVSEFVADDADNHKQE